jgi:hypothetical protein
MAVNLSALAGAGQQFFDNSGNPLTGGKLYSYAAGTTTPQTTYTSVSGATAHTNPIILNAAGRVTTGEIWLTAGQNYKFVLETSANVLIATWDNITGINGTGITSNADNVEYDPPFTGALTNGYTVEDKLRQTVSVKDFGAVGDGVVNDTAAIQAAIDAFKSTDAYDPQETVNIFFPMGNYRVTASLLVYSGTRLIGEGNRSKITADVSLTTQIIELKRTPTTDSINFVVVENLGFYTRGTCWAIKATAATVTEVYLRNLYFDCTYCVDSSTYTQSCEYGSLYSTGPVEQVLLFAGNLNTIRNLVVEGTAGTTTEPTVYFKGHVAGNSSGNLIDRILIENTGSVNKVPLKLEDCDNVSVSGYWMEVANTNGNSVQIVDCNSIRFTDFFRGIRTPTKVNIATTKDVWFDVVDTDSQTEPLASFFTIDATSRVRISRVYCRDAEGIYPKSLIAKNVVIDYVYNRTSSTVTGYQPVSQLSYQGGNIFVNPSFEAGIYGWNTSSMGAYTASYSVSDVANGVMARFQWGAATPAYLYQNITIAAGQIGMPVTFTAWVKNASGVGVIAPLSFGAGIAATSGINYTSGTDWQIITSTVIPQSAGTLSIGFYFEGTTDVYADEASVYFGTVARPNNAEFGSIQLTSKTVLFGSAAPTTGTWVVGSKVFNSAPAVGSPKGWVCTVDGTPGTWVSEGNL